MICLDRSPGFGITLAAETTDGSFLCAEACSHPLGYTEERVSADDIGAKAAFNLLTEIYKVSFFYFLYQNLTTTTSPASTVYAMTYPIFLLLNVTSGNKAVWIKL